jgi:hypothetical protein
MRLVAWAAGGYMHRKHLKPSYRKGNQSFVIAILTAYITGLRYLAIYLLSWSVAR